MFRLEIFAYEFLTKVYTEGVRVAFVQTMKENCGTPDNVNLKNKGDDFYQRHHLVREQGIHPFVYNHLGIHFIRAIRYETFLRDRGADTCVRQRNHVVLESSWRATARFELNRSTQAMRSWKAKAVLM
jgi:hypothetical protein